MEFFNNIDPFRPVVTGSFPASDPLRTQQFRGAACRRTDGT